MAFSTNYKKTERPKLPEGTYEMIITKASYANGKNGEYISLTLEINEKEHPELEGQRVYMNLFKAKTPNEDDRACEGYQAWQIFMISKAVGIPDGQEINSINEWLNLIQFSYVKATVKYNGEYKNVTRLEKTTAKTNIFDAETAKDVDVDEDDLPW